MIPAAFDYARPASLDEALALLARGDGSAKVIAGGQSLLPLMRLRLASPAKLIDIGRLAELRAIRDLGGRIDGHRRSRHVPARCSTRTSSRATTRSWPTRSRRSATSRSATGARSAGSIAHADPASDLPAILLALDASLVIRSGAGERVVGIDGFFQGAFSTDLAEDEILTEIRLPATPAGAGMAYRAIEQPASGYSMVGVAAVVGRGGGTVNHARIGITGVSRRTPTARRPSKLP